MSSPYAGNPALFPTDYPIPDDADPPTAAMVNPALEALGDRTAYLLANQHATEVVTFTAGGTVVVPAWCNQIYYEGCGGGGGGGGGCRAPGTFRGSCGGGGGGGAVRAHGVIGVTPGETLTIAIGAGGAGGQRGIGTGGIFPAGTAPAPGSNGGDTTISRAGPIIIARLKGAQGGDRGRDDEQVFVGASETYAGDPIYRFSFAPGGRSVARILYVGGHGFSMGTNTLDDTSPFHDLGESAGGRGACQNHDNWSGQALPGNSSSNGFLGGTTDSAGTNSGDYLGGGAGGGGGAGAYGDGAIGGKGGNANNAGNSTTATSGANASANTGAGGGGGGASGGSSNAGTATAGTAGQGGNGGSGRCLIVFLRGEP